MEAKRFSIECPVCGKTILVEFEPWAEGAVWFCDGAASCPCIYTDAQYDEAVRRTKAVALQEEGV